MAKFSSRLSSYRNSLGALEQARWRDDIYTDDFVLSGLAAKFSITFELAWKTMKDCLQEHYKFDQVIGSPRTVLKLAYEAGIIESDDGEWMEMLDLRNALSHDYNYETIRQNCDVIVSRYIAVFQALEERLGEIAAEDGEK